MMKKMFSKYTAILIIGLLLIVAYKTLDNAGTIIMWFGGVLKIFVPIFTAFAIAFILYPLCYRAENLISNAKFKLINKNKRIISILLVYIICLIAVCGFLMIIFPLLISSTKDLFRHLPDIIRDVKRYFLNNRPFGINFKNIFRSFSPNKFIKAFKLDDFNMYISHVADFSKAILSILLSVIISVYVLADRASLRNCAIKVLRLLLPQKAKDISSRYAHKSLSILYKYIYCQFVDALIIFVFSFIVLMIMRIKYAPVLAIVMGLFNLIPYFGAILAIVISALLTVFTASLSRGIWVAVVLTVLQQIDANIVQPKIMGDVLEIKPFWVLCGISIGGSLCGVYGILLAVPFMALIKTVFNDYYDYAEHHKKHKNQ